MCSHSIYVSLCDKEQGGLWFSERSSDPIYTGVELRLMGESGELAACLMAKHDALAFVIVKRWAMGMNLSLRQERCFMGLLFPGCKIDLTEVDTHMELGMVVILHWLLVFLSLNARIYCKNFHDKQR